MTRRICVVLEYCDASFADDIRESKSTSGCYLAITGPNTFVPVTSFSKRQGAVSHSSTEAEIISLEEAVRSEGLSVLTFWEHVVLLFGEHRRTRQSSKKENWYVELNSQPAQTFYQSSKRSSGLGSPPVPGAPTGGDAELLREISILGTLRLEHVENFYLAKQYCPQVKLVVAEDNEAVIKIIKKGRSAKLRHIHRTHRVDTDWLYEIFSEPSNLMRYVNTKHQIADFNTKAITKAETLWHLLKLAQVRPPKGEPGDPGGSQANGKSSRGETGKSNAQEQNLPTAACIESAATDQWYECRGCDAYMGGPRLTQ